MLIIQTQSDKIMPSVTIEEHLFDKVSFGKMVTRVKAMQQHNFDVEM